MVSMSDSSLMCCEQFIDDCKALNLGHQCVQFLQLYSTSQRHSSFIRHSWKFFSTKKMWFKWFCLLQSCGSTRGAELWDFVSWNGVTEETPLADWLANCPLSQRPSHKKHHLQPKRGWGISCTGCTSLILENIVNVILILPGLLIIFTWACSKSEAIKLTVTEANVTTDGFISFH